MDGVTVDCSIAKVYFMWEVVPELNAVAKYLHCSMSICVDMS